MSEPDVGRTLPMREYEIIYDYAYNSYGLGSDRERNEIFRRMVEARIRTIKDKTTIRRIKNETTKGMKK